MMSPKLHSRTYEIDEKKYIDIRSFPKTFTTIVSMSLWEKGNPMALSSLEEIHFNWSIFLPRKRAAIIATNKIRKQGLKVANVDMYKDKHR